jgi:hypothetical protein
VWRRAGLGGCGKIEVMERGVGEEGLAAVRCYAAEIRFRAIRNSPEVSDERDGPNLTNWRGYYRVGT